MSQQEIHTDVLIIGAGPGGLACARVLAEQNLQVIVLEKKRTIGAKICAGGITWDGLINVVPEHLIERRFCDQYIFSRHQNIRVSEKNPIIATVNRKTLGQWMARQAVRAGAEVLTDRYVTSINKQSVTVRSSSGEISEIRFSQLVGADGAHSLVRRSLGIPTEHIGPGINYQIPGDVKKMEWHLNTQYFGYGYGWIFPHKNTVSIGAYGPQGNMPAKELKNNLIFWAAEKGYLLAKETCQAAMINYDYRGYKFDNVWLVGDAAGLASGLTGEGIYPAIVSGETVARKIVDPQHCDKAITDMVKKQSQHHKVISAASKYPRITSMLMELLVFMLRCRIINFNALEMAVAKKT